MVNKHLVLQLKKLEILAHWRTQKDTTKDKKSQNLATTTRKCGTLNKIQKEQKER